MFGEMPEEIRIQLAEQRDHVDMSREVFFTDLKRLLGDATVEELQVLQSMMNTIARVGDTGVALYYEGIIFSSVTYQPQRMPSLQ